MKSGQEEKTFKTAQSGLFVSKSLAIIIMSTPVLRSKPNRDKTWRKYYTVHHSYYSGSKKVDVLICDLCKVKNELFTLQSVRIRCVRHLEKTHHWNEVTDSFHPSAQRKDEDTVTIMSSELELIDDGNSSEATTATSIAPSIAPSMPAASSAAAANATPVQRESNTTGIEEESNAQSAIEDIYSSSISASSSSSLFASEVQERAEYLLVAWAYSSNIPPACFDSPFFKEFVTIANRGMSAPSSKDIVQRLNRGFELKIQRSKVYNVTGDT